MQDATDMRKDLESCKTLIASQAKTIDELSSELEKTRKLLSHFVNGPRSEKRILTGPNQNWLPFENSEEFQAARAEAEAQAEVLVDAYKRSGKRRRSRG